MKVGQSRMKAVAMASTLRSRALLGAVISLALCGVAHAVTYITVNDTTDDFEAQKRSDSGVYIASENLASSSRCGHQSNFNGSGVNAPGAITTIFVFQLPALPNPGTDVVTTAIFSVGCLPDTATSSVTPTFNADLYALGVTPTATVTKDATTAQNYWYIGDTAQTTLATPLGGPVVRLKDNFLVPADAIPNGGVEATFPKATDVTSYIANLYANPGANSFTPGTSYLVVRLNPDAATVPTSGTQRYNLAFQGTPTNGGAGQTGSRPRLTLTLNGAAGCADVPSVNISPAPGGATSVIVSNVSPNADFVKVYVNDTTFVGQQTGNPPNTPSTMVITTSALTSGTTITARQTIGVESCGAAPGQEVGACGTVIRPILPGTVIAGGTSVTVTGVDPRASKVTIRDYDGVNNTTIGSVNGSPPSSTPSSVVVSGLPPFVVGHVLKATQTINGLEGCVAPTSGAVVIGSNNTTILTDGFGDGDRDNNGLLDDPDNSGTGIVDDAAGVGSPWYKLLANLFDAKVAHDSPLDNSFNIHVNTTPGHGIGITSMIPVSLKQAGDNVSLTFNLKVNQWATNGDRDNIRFGLFKHDTAGSGAITSDQFSGTNVQNDKGYWGSMNVGAQVNSRRIARGTTTSSTGIFGIVSTITTPTPSGAGISDNNMHTLKLTIARTPSNTAVVELRFDNTIIATDGDTAASSLFDFDEVAIGAVASATNMTPYTDFSFDNVVVLAATNPCHNPVFDADGNGQVDVTDFEAFVACGSDGSHNRIPLATLDCKCMDVEPRGNPAGDNFLDGNDFGRFQLCYTGSTPSSDPNWNNCDN